jgi:hypothetical protein
MKSKRPFRAPLKSTVRRHADEDFAIVLKETWFGSALVRVRLETSPYKPYKKFRYAKRYYRALDRDIAEFTLSESGCDFWHRHLDFYGNGNRSWAERRRHLVAEFALLRRVDELTASWSLPHQAWLQIYPADSGEDALWIHAPDPQSNRFPFSFEGVDWKAPVPDRLSQLLDHNTLEFGRSDADRTIFWVRARAAA